MTDSALTAAQRALLDEILPSTEFTPQIARHRRYDQWKRVWVTWFPEATNVQHDQAMTIIADRTGV